jgi:hypothetical protein
MTTVAAMLAGVPLMLGFGTGSELRQPLGYAMVGGLAFSQVLTLYTTPVVYLYLGRLQTWLAGRKGPIAQEPAPSRLTTTGSRGHAPQSIYELLDPVATGRHTTRCNAEEQRAATRLALQRPLRALAEQ